MLFEQKNFDAAKKIFQELIQIDEDADFAIEAREYLEKIKNEESSVDCSIKLLYPEYMKNS